MRTLSIRQPFAWLIMQGIKDIENRDWKTDYRGPMLIHVSKTYTRKEHNQVADWIEQDFGITIPTYEYLCDQKGMVIGKVKIIDCTPSHSSAWYIPESYAFVLADPFPLQPVPWKGQLGFFDVPLHALTGNNQNA